MIQVTKPSPYLASEDLTIDVEGLISGMMTSALLECCHPQFIKDFTEKHGLTYATSMAADDALAFTAKDPASGSNPIWIVKTYTSFKAVLHYRLASSVIQLAPDLEEANIYAQLIMARGKLLSGAEIHPHSKIGKRFVLDHGMGTVIGQTVEMGNDCYVLGGVTLGATGIAENPSCKRHPTIGNRVQIGAFSSILGNVSVGDNVFIGAHCVITNDIPSNTKVTLKTSHLYTRTQI